MDSHSLPGYLNAGYAHSLAEFGRPRALPESGSWVLERSIPGSEHRDAMGCYPLFLCKDWSALPMDLTALAEDLITLTLVTDPFVDDAVLKESFQNVEPFKTHLVVDLDEPREKRSSRHHRYYARFARRSGVEVSRADNPLELVDEWAELYENLCSRHAVRGVRAFSRESFEQQLSLPGVALFTAVKGGELVAAHIWFVHEDHAYSHLQATSEVGYECRAAYALYEFGLNWLSEHCSCASLGASPGAFGSDDGLTVFKRGWSTGSTSTFLCFEVFDRQVYEDLSRSRRSTGSNYRPLYRAEEFT